MLNVNTMKTQEITDSLEYLRGELRAERISTAELIELQSLAEHIAPDDVELLEAAGVPEFPEEENSTTENNKLIDLWMAEFEVHESDKLTIINDLENKGASPQSYHNDWNLLMAVVEKIDSTPVLSKSDEEYYYCVKLEGSVAEILDANTGKDVIHVSTLTNNWRESTYKAVTEFIKWYNQNK